MYSIYQPESKQASLNVEPSFKKRRKYLVFITRLYSWQSELGSKLLSELHVAQNDKKYI